ncbi:MAG: sugar phosphate isomerase/epimerase family protein [Sphaerochaeta sp.]
MKFGISSYVWVSPFSNSTFSQLDKAKLYGFDIYEIGVENPSAFDVFALKKYADKVGIQVNICGTFSESRDISSDNEEYRNEGMVYIRKIIEYASILGSRFVAGPMYAATGRTRLASAEEKQRQMSFVVENLKELCDYASELGVVLALEPLNRFETDFMNTVDQGLHVIKLVERENLGFLLDIFHMNIEEKSIIATIHKAGKHIFNFHACANDRGIPGEDSFDWKAIAQALQDVGYDGAITIESFTNEIKDIARAVSLWRPLAPSQDILAKKGLAFLKETFK